jgi:large subunit ribosomal protein L27
LGVWRYDGEPINAGNIIIRQRTRSIRHERGQGKHDTLFAKVTGVVKFERKDKTRKR